MRGTKESITFLVLYARSRYLPYILPTLVAIIVIASWWAHSKAPDIRYDVDREIIQRNLISSITVLAAISLTFTVGSPWGEMDNAAGIRLQRIRLGLFMVVVAVIALLMIGAGFLWESPTAPWMLLRDLLGWIGITLVATRFLGENYARLVSIAWAGIAVTSGDSWRVHYPPWAWSMQDSANVTSWAIAILLLITGFLFLMRSRFPTEQD